MTAHAAAQSSLRNWTGLAAILLVALFLRWPGVGYRLPYFSNEDEAHHYNRLLEMYKSGDLNPHYFHKPSLHFYLRLPVVAVASWWDRSQGGLQSSKELITRDPYGLADYAFSASHPGVLQWSRAFSVLLSLLLVYFTYAVSRLASQSSAGGFIAAAIVALSPPLIEHAALIGVDVLMALNCLIAAWLSLKTVRKFSHTSLAFAAVFVGLAVSSKYNAGPIAVLPLFASYLAGRLERRSILISLILPVLGFFIGSPYILVSLDLFSRHLRYEMWHYAVAGHAGHMAEPGLQQALFYLSWFKDEALGAVLTALSLAGGVLLAFQPRGPQRSVAYLLLAFPLLYFLLMIAQKTNFTRNMLVLIPFLAVFAAYLLTSVFKNFALSPKASVAWLLVVTLGALAAPAYIAGRAFLGNLNVDDSRNQALHWLRKRSDEPRDVAVGGQLQFSSEVLALKGVSRINQDVIHPLDLYLSGFGFLVRGPQDPFAEELALYAKEQVRFPGSLTRDRIVVDPEVKIFRFEEGPALEQALERHRPSNPVPKIIFTFSGLESTGCGVAGQSSKEAEAEGHCWLSARRQMVALKDIGLDRLSGKGRAALILNLMSPWPNQRAKLKLGDELLELQWGSNDLNSFRTERFEVKASTLAAVQDLLIEISEVHSPKTQGISSDARRLGIAIRDIKVE